MKVHELIAELEKMNPDQSVWISEDDEGNSYRLLYQVTEENMSTDLYDPYTIHPEDIDIEDVEGADYMKVAVIS